MQISSAIGNSFVEADLGLPNPGWRRKVQISSAIGNSFVEGDLGLPNPGWSKMENKAWVQMSA